MSFQSFVGPGAVISHQPLYHTRQPWPKKIIFLLFLFCKIELAGFTDIWCSFFNKTIILSAVVGYQMIIRERWLKRRLTRADYRHYSKK